MGKTGSNLLFLAVGAAIGAAVGYIAASDKKEEWLEEMNNMVGKGKDYVRTAMSRGKKSLEELADDGE